MRRNLKSCLIVIISIAALLAIVIGLSWARIIPPYRTELWMDLYSARMEHRNWPLFGKMEVVHPQGGYTNTLYGSYLTYVGPAPGKADWVLLSSGKGYGPFREEVETEMYSLLFDQNGVSNMVSGSYSNTYSDLQPLELSAKREYILRFLEVCRKSRSVDTTFAYFIVHSKMIEHGTHPIGVADLIDVDEFIADPVAEHYYDASKLE